MSESSSRQGGRSAIRWFTRPFRTTADDIRDPRRPTWKRVGTAFAVAFVFLSILPAAFMLYALLLLPQAPGGAELQRQTAAYPTIVLAADGSEIAQLESRNRVRVPLDSIAPVFLDALLAVEDRRFYKHEGVDWRRMGRAGLRTVGGRTEGGSTITQQLARNLYPDEIGRELSMRRKLKEIIAARRIERTHTKEQILESYVNSVPFLYNAFGVEMAARTYFGKHAIELDAVESATLVGMLKGTSYYNPVRYPERSEERRNLVLRLMADHGVLDASEAEELREKPLELDFERQEGPTSDHPHFTRFVREWLSEWADRNRYDLFSDGLVVHTTLDPTLQRTAEEVVRRRGEQLHQAAGAEWRDAGGTPFGQLYSRFPDLEERALRDSQEFKEAVAAGVSEEAALDSLRSDTALRDSLRAMKTRLEVGFVAIHPRTGHVKAWVGSRDFNVTPFDHVWRARRQPGSVFKPFVYAAALQRGFLPGDTFIDEQRSIDIGYGRQWRPANAGGAYTGGPITLTEGLAYSKNTVTAQLMMEVGPTYVASLARDMGVRESRLEPVPALALGASEVTLLEMATSYATIAAGGQYKPPVPVTRVEDRNGRVLSEFGTNGERAMSRDAAQVLTHMMRGVIERGTGRRIRGEFGITADVAGKTGTSQHGADGWFMLMHPELVMGAWVGFPEPRITFRTSQWGQGSRNALPIVGDFFRTAQAHVPEGRFETPQRYQEPGSIWERARGWWDGLFEREEGLDPDDFPDDESLYRAQWDDDPVFEWGDEADPLEGLDLDPTDDLDNLDTFTADEAEQEPTDATDPPQDERTAVQRLYDEAGEDLEEDLRDDG